MKKLLAMLMASSMVAAMMTGCGAQGENNNDKAKPSEDANTISIGALAPLTGNVSVYGKAAANGFKLATQKINEQGGVLGKQVELRFEDEEGDTMKAINAFNKLVGDGVVAILGDVTSKPTISVAQKSIQVKGDEVPIPMMTPTATAADVTTFGNNVFRACFLDPFQGKAMATYAKDKLKTKTIAVLYDSSDDYSLGTADAFKEKAEEMGMKVVNYEAFVAGDQDFKSQLTKINKSNPDVLFVPSYYNTIALIGTQAKQVGLKSQLLGCDGWDGVLSALTEQDKHVVDGAIFSNHYYTEDKNPVVSDFVSKYRTKYKEDPNAFAALGYDGAMMLFEAIERAGNTDRAAITKELAATDYTGVTGHIYYEGSGDPVKTLTMITIKDGKYELLEEYDANKNSDEAPADAQAQTAETPEEQPAA